MIATLRGLLAAAAHEVVGLIRLHPMLFSLIVGILCTGLLAHRQLGLPWPNAIYETGRIFFDGADTSVGADREAPSWVFALLWGDRFLAPLVAGGTVLELVHRLSRHGAVRPWWRRHVIVVGAGNLGTALARHHARQGRRVVMIERDGDNPNLEGLRTEGVTVVEGDARQGETLVRARAGVARRIIAVAGDDIANFAAILHASRLAKHPIHAHAHVGDPELRARLVPVLADRFAAPDPLFSGFEVAAKDLVSRHELLRGQGPHILVVAGYGRFGQAVVGEVLRLHGHRADLSIWIVDPNLDSIPLSPLVLAWREGGRLRLMDMDMLDDRVQGELHQNMRAHTRVDFVLCTDNDGKNLAFALAMHHGFGGHCAALRIVARMIEWSPVEGAAMPGVEVVSIKDLVLDGLCKGS
ncbi:MAG TPA: NAD-binding protein [Myxococcota bacterium]|nr:NAD-binding protein [Myxococcota bacterium]